MQKQARIGIDLLGCERSPEELFSSLPVMDCVYYVFSKNSLPFREDCISFDDCEEILLTDDPIKAIKKKKRSSITCAIKLLQEKTLDAFISCGHSGALLAAATTMLPTSVARPALIALVPTKGSPLAVIDVGANISCRAKHLLDFAKLGIAFQKARGIASPRIGLLNIGKEERKGTDELKKAFLLLQKEPSFVGNVEANEVFEGFLDVLITDGFSGNIFLKTAEGAMQFLLNEKEKLEFYPGAFLAGVDGLIIKCHSSITISSYKKAIEGALPFVQKNISSLL